MNKSQFSTKDLPARRHRISKYFGLMILIGFVLNASWEMGQMGTYAETASQPWRGTLALCARAAAGDVVILFGIYFGTAIAVADSFWSFRGKWKHYAIAMVVGIGTAALIEHVAVVDGRWTYNSRMPLVPFFDAGLWPLLQMLILPPLTILMSAHFSGGQPTRKWGMPR